MRRGPIGSTDPTRTGGNGPRKYWKVLPAIAAMVVAASCGGGEDSQTSPDREPKATATSEAKPDEQTTIETAQLPQEIIDVLSELDVSDEASQQATGYTKEEVISIVNDDYSVPEAFAELLREVLGREDVEAADYPWADREMLQAMLTGEDVEVINDYIRRLNLSASELVAGINEIDRSINAQQSLAAIIQEQLINAGPPDSDTNTPNPSYGLFVTGLMQIEEVKNRAITRYALSKIAQGVLEGEYEIRDTAACDSIDVSTVFVAKEPIFYRIRAEHGFVEIGEEGANEISQPFYNPTYTAGIRPITRPLPGVRGDEIDCSTNLGWADSLHGWAMQRRLTPEFLDGSPQTELDNAMSILAESLYPVEDPSVAPPPGTIDPETFFIQR